MMNCKEIHTRFFSSNEESHSVFDKKELDAHFATCHSCKKQWEVYTMFSSLIAQQKNAEPSAWFESKLMQKIENVNVAQQQVLLNASKPQWIYIAAISFAILLAFATGYFIGENNYKYISTSNQNIQNQNSTNLSDNAQEEQYENFFSIY